MEMKIKVEINGDFLYHIDEAISHLCIIKDMISTGKLVNIGSSET